MSRNSAKARFEAEVGAALALLSDAVPGAERPSGTGSEPSGQALAASLPSLLDQCRQAIDALDHPDRPEIRSIHHLACTGGTLIAKAIACMPSTSVLSEVDPLSTHNHPFVPTDLVNLARFGSRPPGDETLLRVFFAGLKVLRAEEAARGLSLVLRDHSHGHFCFGPTVRDSQTFYQLLCEDYTTLAVVTVRHPMESFLSLVKNGWLHFKPGNLAEYCRRYHAFLDHYDTLPTIKYEDFVEDPHAQMQEICAHLKLRYNPDFQLALKAIRLSGDSGRRGDTIARRAPKPVPEARRTEAQSIEDYLSLCERMGYPVFPE